MGLEDVGYCGLYCGLCASRRRLPAQAAALRHTLVKEGYDSFSADIPYYAARWKPFRELLDRLAAVPCPACRGDGGYPDCPVRICARERGYVTCADCAAWPCERGAFLKRYIYLPADVERLRAIGLDKWIAEQEERAAAGFCHADLRHPWEVDPGAEVKE